MDTAEATSGAIHVEIVCSPHAGQLWRMDLTLPEGATVAQAVERSGWALPDDLRAGVWGRPCALTDSLREHDRVELYRPLTVDPKEARRVRYRSHRAAKNT